MHEEEIIVGHFLEMHVEFLDVGNRISFPSKFVKFWDLKVFGKMDHGDSYIKWVRTNTLKLEFFGVISFLDFLEGIFHFFPLRS